LADTTANNSATTGSLLKSFSSFGKDIKIAHTIFAMPFAASALILGGLGLPTLTQCIGLLGAMIGARTYAMGMNRYLDRHIDAQNPRTVNRMIPSGSISAKQTLIWSFLSAILLIISSFSLSSLAGKLSLPMLIVLMSYSFFKRFSWSAHYYLGFCLGLAPVAVEIALTGSSSAAVLCVGAAISFWTAGFDILYSLQDMEYDRSVGLYSIPSRFGANKSLWISRISFVATVGLLILAGEFAAMGILYFFGVAVIGGILAFEHWLVKDARNDGQSKNINAAFFNTNAWVSVAYLAFSIIDTLTAG
jgi:4-hydroxybenzoate polyprenyltransferase